MNVYIEGTIDFCRKCLKVCQEENILHVGCGDGQLTTEVLLQLFNNNQWIVGTDASDVNLSAARTSNHQGARHYLPLDITNSEEVRNFRRSHGPFTKIFCLSCSNWILKPQEAVNNINILLETNGQCFFAFIGSSDVYSAYEKLIDDPECGNFVQDYHELIPTCHSTEDSSEFLRRCFTNSGIEMMWCKIRQEDMDVDDLDIMESHIKLLSEVLGRVPPSQKETFEKLCFKAISDLQNTVMRFQTVFVYALKRCEIEESTDEEQADRNYRSEYR